MGSMKPKTDNPCKARGVSLPKDIDRKVDERIKQLKPRVKGFSHYVQLLIDLDLSGKNDSSFSPANASTLALAA